MKHFKDWKFMSDWMWLSASCGFGQAVERWWPGGNPWVPTVSMLLCLGLAFLFMFLDHRREMLKIEEELMDGYRKERWRMLSNLMGWDPDKERPQ